MGSLFPEGGRPEEKISISWGGGRDPTCSSPAYNNRRHESERRGPRGQKKKGGREPTFTKKNRPEGSSWGHASGEMAAASRGRELGRGKTNLHRKGGIGF